jgi:hypothetical protein
MNRMDHLTCELIAKSFVTTRDYLNQALLAENLSSPRILVVEVTITSRYRAKLTLKAQRLRSIYLH